MTKYPLCFGCTEAVDTDPVYEAVCGHDDCPSAVFHPLCLMEWREHREKAMKVIKSFIESHPMFRRES